MTKWKCKTGVFMLILLMTGSLAFANSPLKKQLVKEIHQSFDVESNALLGVHNKYGNVDITTWDRNRIEVDILIKVKTKSESKGKTFIEGVNVDFSPTPSKVGMKTIYPDQDNSSWWGSWWSNSNNIDFEVHYTIKAPKGISTTLINKYGSITQASIGGSCTVTNKYGDIYLDNIGEDLTLNLGYGKAKIGQARNVTVEIKNSEFVIGDCNNVQVNSKYSDFNFGACGNMSLDTKYDEFVIESAQNIRNNGKYDSFKIGEIESLNLDTKNTTVVVKRLNKNCRVDTKYGSVNVKSTGPNMESISLESKYTEYKFGVDADFHLTFVGDYTDLNIDVPHEKYKSNRDGHELEVRAYRGSENAGLTINAGLKYGGLSIVPNR